MDHLISARRLDLMIINKKRTNRIVNFAVRADYRAKLKENEEGSISRPCLRIKKLWNMKVTVIPIVIGELGTIPIGLIVELEKLEIRENVGTIQITASLRSA